MVLLFTVLNFSYSKFLFVISGLFQQLYSPALLIENNNPFFAGTIFFLNFTVHLYSTSACKLTILLTRTDFTSTPNLEASSSLARKTETGKDSYSNCLFHTPSIHLYKICSLMTYLLPIIAFIMHLSSCRDKYKYKKQQIKRT